MTATPTTPSCQSGAVLEYLNVNAYYLNLARRESDTGPQAAQQGRDGSVGKLAAVLPSRQANRLSGCARLRASEIHSPSAVAPLDGGSAT